MDELKGLEKMIFTGGKHSPSTQFSKKFVKVAKDKFRDLDYSGIDNNIFCVGDGVYCFGVRNKFEISGNQNILTIYDKGFSGDKLEEEDVSDICSQIIENLSNSYSISQTTYK